MMEDGYGHQREEKQRCKSCQPVSKEKKNVQNLLNMRENQFVFFSSAHLYLTHISKQTFFKNVQRIAMISNRGKKSNGELSDDKCW